MRPGKPEPIFAFSMTVRPCLEKVNVQYGIKNPARGTQVDPCKDIRMPTGTADLNRDDRVLWNMTDLSQCLIEGKSWKTDDIMFYGTKT